MQTTGDVVIIPAMADKSQLLGKVLEKISKGAVTRPEAAQELGCSERHVSRLMRSYGVRRPPSEDTLARAAGKARRAAKRDKDAMIAKRVKLLLQNKDRPERIAKDFDVSIRTIFRHAAALKTRENKGKSLKSS